MNYTNTTADEVLRELTRLKSSEVFDLLNNNIDTCTFLGTSISRNLFNNESFRILPPQPTIMPRINIDRVPNEVIHHIFSFNDPIDHCRIRRACREWRDMPLDGYEVANSGYKASNAVMSDDNAATNSYEATNTTISSRRIVYAMGTSMMTKTGDKLDLMLRTRGILDGRRIVAMNGVMIFKETYENNERITFSRYWNNGAKKLTFTKMPCSSFYVGYDSNGLLSSFCFYKDSVKKKVKWTNCGKITSIFNTSTNVVAQKPEILHIEWQSNTSFIATYRMNNVERVVYYNC